MIGLDAVVSDGPWPGSRTRLIDDTNLGPYFFEVIDRQTNQPIYSRGFASIYGEWETTDEAGRDDRSYHESVRFPWPKAPVQVVLKKRDRRERVPRDLVDRGRSRLAVRQPRPDGARREGVDGVRERPPAAKVDLLILGDGYTEAELPKFHADVRRLVEGLFPHEPFKGRQEGLQRPGDRPPLARAASTGPHGDFRRTPLGVSYNIFDSERYV